MADEQQSANKIIVKTMEEVMHESMMPYSEHVILDRALPRVEDGLKPVQRRILYSMYELGVLPDRPYRKSARIVGDCMGKYHPHGDKSIYDAIVRMAQSFNMRGQLVDGHGNFGSVDGDSAAAMRYTEARLAPLAMELLRDIDKETVKFSCNFDDTLSEPDMLPGRYPNLLVNGASGIAVGLATNIPPHNLCEVIDGVIAFIDNPRISLEKMMKHIKGPDFPTGGFLITGTELLRAYETGRGKVVQRAKIHIETGANEKKNIVITELPYQVNKSALLESILALREEKKQQLQGISEICDESDRNGMRAVIRVKKDFDPKAICNVLFKSTNLQTSFAFNIVAIADGKPQQMGLLDIIAYYVDYQRTIILRRTRYELEEARAQAHILEGLIIAVKNIDAVIKIIRASANTAEARQRLRDKFSLSEKQAQAILDLRLARLTKLEIEKLEKELKDVLALIERLESILATRHNQMELIKSELLAIKRNYKEPRRTAIIGDLTEYVITADDDEKPIERCIVAVSCNDYIKKMSIRSYSSANKDSSNCAPHEIMKIITEAQSDQLIYAFTNMGNCYKIETAAIPEAKWREKGAVLEKVCPEALAGEKIVFTQVVADSLPRGNLLFFSKQGMIKKSSWTEYGIVKSSFQAVKVNEGDEILNIEPDLNDTTIMFITEGGICLNADKSEIPTQGRIAAGVKGVMLTDDDRVLFAGQVSPEGEMYLLSGSGLGKRVLVSSIDVMARYRKGIKIVDLKQGSTLVSAGYVTMPYTVVCDTPNGLTTISTEDFPIENRTTKGKQIVKSEVLNANRYRS